jgi:hypothetical protein
MKEAELNAAIAVSLVAAAMIECHETAKQREARERCVLALHSDITRLYQISSIFLKLTTLLALVQADQVQSRLRW